MTPVNFSFIIFLVWQFDPYQQFGLQGQICSLPLELLKSCAMNVTYFSTRVQTLKMMHCWFLNLNEIKVCKKKLKINTRIFFDED